MLGSSMQKVYWSGPGKVFSNHYLDTVLCDFSLKKKKSELCNLKLYLKNILKSGFFNNLNHHLLFFNTRTFCSKIIEPMVVQNKKQ